MASSAACHVLAPSVSPMGEEPERGGRGVQLAHPELRRAGVHPDGQHRAHDSGRAAMWQGVAASHAMEVFDRHMERLIQIASSHGRLLGPLNAMLESQLAEFICIQGDMTPESSDGSAAITSANDGRESDGSRRRTLTPQQEGQALETGRPVHQLSEGNSDIVESQPSDLPSTRRMSNNLQYQGPADGHGAILEGDHSQPLSSQAVTSSTDQQEWAQSRPLPSLGEQSPPQIAEQTRGPSRAGPAEEHHNWGVNSTSSHMQAANRRPASRHQLGPCQPVRVLGAGGTHALSLLNPLGRTPPARRSLSLAAPGRETTPQEERNAHRERRRSVLPTADSLGLDDFADSAMDGRSSNTVGPGVRRRSTAVPISEVTAMATSNHGDGRPRSILAPSNFGTRPNVTPPPVSLAGARIAADGRRLEQVHQKDLENHGPEPKEESTLPMDRSHLCPGTHEGSDCGAADPEGQSDSAEAPGRVQFQVCAVCLDEVVPCGSFRRLERTGTLAVAARAAGAELEEEDVEIITLRCGHQLHLACLLPWLLPDRPLPEARQSAADQVSPALERTCPVCRCALSPGILALLAEYHKAGEGCYRGALAAAQADGPRYGPGRTHSTSTAGGRQITPAAEATSPASAPHATGPLQAVRPDTPEPQTSSRRERPTEVWSIFQTSAARPRPNLSRASSSSTPFGRSSAQETSNVLQDGRSSSHAFGSTRTDGGTVTTVRNHTGSNVFRYEVSPRVQSVAPRGDSRATGGDRPSWRF